MTQATFLVFSADTYYPQGGMRDCVGAFESWVQAKRFVDQGDVAENGHIAKVSPDGVEIVHVWTKGKTTLWNEDGDPGLEGPRWEVQS